MARKKNLSSLIGETTQSSTKLESPLSLNDSKLTDLETKEMMEFYSKQVAKLGSSKQKFASSQEEEIPESKTEFETNKLTDSDSKARNKIAREEKIAFSTPTKYQISEDDSLSEKEEKLPKYLTLVRKEARLREEQLDDLTILVRKLNRSRKAKGERITENTLIRLAVDLLLQQKSSLTGINEEELRQSLGLDSNL
ncbi:hypothetical protein [Cyanobacterium aponinum]|uniref:hypothetical protein n=1 Tax=Cyanobacterium aponinum TaxID=379064 RepID=UPI0018F02890|nr:hypothetical protein [Cyanobacterium aponinum]